MLASVAQQRDHFAPVMAALLGCFRGAAGSRLLQVGRGERQSVWGRCAGLRPAWWAASEVSCRRADRLCFSPFLHGWPHSGAAAWPSSSCRSAWAACGCIASCPACCRQAWPAGLRRLVHPNGLAGALVGSRCCPRCLPASLPRLRLCVANQAQEEEDASFASAVVQALNLILLTSSSLQVGRGASTAHHTQPPAWLQLPRWASNCCLPHCPILAACPPAAKCRSCGHCCRAACGRRKQPRSSPSSSPPGATAAPPRWRSPCWPRRVAPLTGGACGRQPQRRRRVAPVFFLSRMPATHRCLHAAFLPGPAGVQPGL